MILPTIINVTEASLNAVPSSYYEGSLALGATHERSVFCVIVPAAKSGVLSAVILGVGRAIGETMALIMVAGDYSCHAGRTAFQRKNPYLQYRYGDGLRTGTSQRGPDCNCRCIIRIYIND